MEKRKIMLAASITFIITVILLFLALEEKSGALFTGLGLVLLMGNLGLINEQLRNQEKATKLQEHQIEKELLESRIAREFEILIHLSKQRDALFYEKKGGYQGVEEAMKAGPLPNIEMVIKTIYSRMHDYDLNNLKMYIASFEKAHSRYVRCIVSSLRFLKNSKLPPEAYDMFFSGMEESELLALVLLASQREFNDIRDTVVKHAYPIVSAIIDLKHPEKRESILG